MPENLIQADGFVNEPERIAFERFSDELAPVGWTIAHNLYLSRHDRRGISASELDMLLLHPEHGILVVEVKGGRIERHRDGTWFQNGDPMGRNPEQQANGIKADLKRLFGGHIRWQSLGIRVPPIGVMVCFPGADLTSATEARVESSASLADDQVIDRPRLNRKGGVLDRVSAFAHRLRSQEGHFAPGFDWTDVALEIVSPELKFSTSLVGDLEVDLARLEADERIHRDWVDNLDGMQRLHFEGGAGAGKSVVARLRARALADSGSRVLLVCSTASLAKSFQADLGRWDDGRVLANTLHQALLVLARETGTPERFGIPASGTPDLDQVRALPEMASEIAEASVRRFDALIVDEAQDIGGDVVRSLTRFLESPDSGRVWTFGDYYQRLDPAWVEAAAGGAAAEGAEHIVMRQNHRNPEPIFRLAEGLRSDGVVRIHRHGGMGHRRVDYRECTDTDQRDVLEQVVRELAQQRIEPGKIAVVTMLKTDSNPLFAPRRIGKWFELGNPQLDVNGRRLPIAAEELPPPDPTKVYFDSARRIKGLERGIVILVDVPDPGPRGSLERRLLYMGATRATTYLSVIATPERVAKLKDIAAGHA